MFNLFTKSTAPVLPAGFAPGVETVLHGDSALTGANLSVATQDERSDRLYAYELSLMLEAQGSGWEDLADTVGSTRLLVKINPNTQQVFTFHDGQITLVSCIDAQAFAERVAKEHKSYGITLRGYALVNKDGMNAIYDHARQTFFC